jgi:hypothetical protein
MAYSELRVHGMSGTPPRDLLYSDPVSYDRRDPFARIYESNRDGREVKAFHWGSLTSGSRGTAFWLLLTPFMLANLAGWMASTKAWVQAFIRLTSLFLTCLLVAQGAVVLISYVNEIFDEQSYHAAAVAGGSGLLALLFFAILWRLSARSLVEYMTPLDKIRTLFGVSEDTLDPPRMAEDEEQLQVRDPAPEASLIDPRMWVRQSILFRLRRQHLAAGILVIVVALELRPGRSIVLIVALRVAALVVLDTLLISVDNGLANAIRAVSAPKVPMAIALLVASIIGLFQQPLPGGGWPHIHQLVLYIAILVGLSSLGTLLTQLAERHSNWLLGFLPISALAISATIGGAMGVAAALFAELASYRFLGDLNPFQQGKPFYIEDAAVMVNGGAWTVESMLCFLLALATLAAGAGWTRRRKLAPRTEEGQQGQVATSKDGWKWGVMRQITTKAAWIFGGAGVTAAVLAVTAAGIACFQGEPGCDPTLLNPDAINQGLPLVAGLLAALLTVALAGAVWPVSRPLGALILPIGALAIWLVFDTQFNSFVWTVPIIDLPVRPARFLDLSVVVIVFGLTFFIVRSIVGGFGDPEKRRRVGILWDTGSFWPRWFHPLAPPSYSPHAVRTLNAALASEESEILAAHSQGSVISCVALAQPGAPLPRAFVTYGSPLGILYDQLFPYAGVRALIAFVDARWGPTSHWVNLWRNTDPLGGDPLPGMNGNKEVALGIGHSQYELENDYNDARTAAITGIARSAPSGPTP